MPEIKHSFTKGRMNQDLDERLVPSGEYRDALNIEVSTSEGPNVGAVQTTMGNINLSNIPGLVNAFCVGSIADEKNDKLYWLIASDDRDIIAEYNYVTNNTEPVLVDMHKINGALPDPIPRVLNFVSERYITGINIIDDMLFWTDNHTEPKHINITRCKHGSVDFITHTNFFTSNPHSGVIPAPLWLGVGNPSSRPIREEHITTIKESPKTAPVLEMKMTLEGRVGGVIADKDFTDNGVLPNTASIPQPQTDITLDAGTYSYEPGDILLLTSINNNANELQIRVKVSAINVGGDPATFTVKILSIDAAVLSIDTYWEVELEQKAALFQFKFPRFATRYKYEDGEYSAFSPFTEIAFLPEGGDFDYLPKKGFNLSMVNDIRHLAIKDFVPEEDILPDGVAEIEILYKETTSANIYSIKSLKRSDKEWNNRYRLTTSWQGELINESHSGWTNQYVGGHDYKHTKGYIKITSEMIHAVLPSNQLLRPWDNVPRKALAQEITGNRLVYGNYLQNYNVQKQTLKLEANSKELPGWNYVPEQIFPVNSELYYPAKSIKSLRTYQLGVVYIDKYGRETPVFSEEDNNEASKYLDKWYANRQNRLSASITSTPPSWAKYFKYFIKETSNEYYNLAVDRWYDAKDDNVWLSFPSSERNKVDEDTFLILKKEHDSSTFVTEDARYKILAISEEAPKFIKETVKSFGTISDNNTKDVFADGGGTGFPLVGYTLMWVDATPFEDQGWDITLADKTNLYMRMISGSTRSQWYSISSISKNTQSGSHWQIAIATFFDDDMAFTSTNNSYLSRIGGLKLEIMQRVDENKAEFDGRFFVKIHKDLTLKERLIGQNADSKYYVIKQARPFTYINSRSQYSHSGTYTYTDVDGNGRANTAWYGWGHENSSAIFEPRIQIDGGDGGTGASFWQDVKNSNGDPYQGRWIIDDQQAFCEAGASGQHLLLQPIAANTQLYESYHWKGAMPPAGTMISGGSPQAGFCEMNTCYDEGSWETYQFNWPSQQYAGFMDHTQLNSYNDPYGGNRKTKSSKGIRRHNKLINVSFSGGGKSVETNSFYGDIVGHIGGGTHINPDNLRWHALPLENWGVYVSEMFFVETLSTHGTLWRWAEDPELHVYKSIGSSHGPTVMWNFTEDLHEGGNVALGGDPSHPYGAQGTSGWHSISIYGIYSKNQSWAHDARCWRNRYTFHAESLSTGLPPGNDGDQKYLPTNPPNWVYEPGKTHQIREYKDDGSVVQVDLNPSSATTHVKNNHPLYRINEPAGANYTQGMDTYDQAPNNPMGYAPGIRHDGMPNESYAKGFGALDLFGNVQTTKIGKGDNPPGTVMWQILEEKDDADLKFASHNPAIFETEPKEDIGLDIYYEIGQVYPIELNSVTNEMYIPIDCDVTCWRPAVGNIDLNLDTSPIPKPQPVRVSAINDNEVTLVDGTTSTITPFTDSGANGIDVGDFLFFTRADGSATSAWVIGVSGQSSGIYHLDKDVYKRQVFLPWFNCYSFGNGVESDRIRDDYNQVKIDNGPKASTTLEEPYMEERRGSGLIYSGLYNSTSGINNLNQFIQAEKITKDLNPSYGSIQKLHSRNTNLVTLCEDKILKVLANKDALYNADGDVNVTATNRVLGQTTPFLGEFGISKNPESFAKESYRVYFSDRTRGSVLRLSQDGITPISDVGMKDYFSDNLRETNSIVGSFDDKKQSYNITLNRGKWDEVWDIKLGKIVKHFVPGKSDTLSFGEDIRGWSSFKSFIQENGLSMNNTYYTFNGGDLWQHHANETRNNYYGTQFDSYVRVLFNEEPGTVKSFGTLNYEGSQAKNTPDLNDVEYYNNFMKLGWYVEEIYTNLQNGTSLEFKDKESKWFSKIQGEATRWLGDGKAGNIDTQEFSYQGIGNAGVDCPECTYTWECEPGTPIVLPIPGIPAIPATPLIPAVPGTPFVPAGPPISTCDNLGITHSITAPEIVSETQLKSWLTNNVNRSIDFNDKKICIPMSAGGTSYATGGWATIGISFSTGFIFPDDICPCTSPEVLSGFSIGGFIWAYGGGTSVVPGVHTGGPGLPGFVGYSWDDFISGLIATGDPIFTSVIVGMSYAMLIDKMQYNITSLSLNPLDYGTLTGGMWEPSFSWVTCSCTPGAPEIPATPGTPEIPATPGVPAVPGTPGRKAGPCFCVEVLGPQGYANQSACENDPNNCCVGGVAPTACLPCSDPGADTSVPGCCDDSGTQTNYNPNATCDDQSCIPTIYGCMDDGTDPNYPGRPSGYIGQALNYYFAAQVEDGNCIYSTSAILGCTDPTATNYNSLATQDDGSCLYSSSPNCITQPVTWTWNGTNLTIDSTAFDPAVLFPNATSTVLPVQTKILRSDGTEVQWLQPNPASPVTGGNLLMTTSWTWSNPFSNIIPGNYTAVQTVFDGNVISGSILSQCSTAITIAGLPISGCTDPLATNYNSSATIDDGSCVYAPTSGCTDPLATNYDPSATVDDGSCTYPAATCDPFWPTPIITTLLPLSAYPGSGWIEAIQPPRNLTAGQIMTTNLIDPNGNVVVFSNIGATNNQSSYLGNANQSIISWTVGSHNLTSGIYTLRTTVNDPFQGGSGQGPEVSRCEETINFIF